MRNRKVLLGIGIVGALLFCWIMATAQSCGLIAPAEPIPTFTATATTAPATPTVLLPTPTQKPPRTPTPTAKPIPQRKLDEWDYIEMPADDLLKLWGKPLKSITVGQDSRGAIGEWWYEDVIVTLKRWELDGVTCYRVHEIRVR